MAIAKTWLAVAAEAREFDGIREQWGQGSKLHWPAAQFACEVITPEARWWLVANGPGPRLVEQMLADKRNVEGIVSTGYCGALDPSLHVGDIVISSKPPQTTLPFAHGPIVSEDHVAVTAEEKRALREATGAIAVEMEAAAVEIAAQAWGVPFHCIRVVSDEASADFPLDFNQYRDAQGRFSRGRITLAALARPFTAIPSLLRLDKNCRNASRKLGVFFADCRF